MIPCYTCLDQISPADSDSQGTLDHRRTAHRLYSITTYQYTIIRVFIHEANKEIYYDQYTNSKKISGKGFKTHLHIAMIT